MPVTSESALHAPKARQQHLNGRLPGPGEVRVLGSEDYRIIVEDHLILLLGMAALELLAIHEFDICQLFTGVIFRQFALCACGAHGYQDCVQVDATHMESSENHKEIL